MPFDSIMGVGRSPKITEDIQTNPFSFGTTLISQYADITKELIADDTEVGSEKEIINPDFDSSIDYAYQLTQNFSAAGGAEVSNIVFDFRKVLYISKVEIRFRNGATFAAVDTRIDISLDGKTWTRILDIGLQNTDATFNFVNLKFRFLRLQCRGLPVGAGTAYLRVRYMKVFLDSIQY